MRFHSSSRIASLALALATLGCAKSDAPAVDTAATAPAAAAPDTAMAGMNRPAPKDGDHEFLRMMADHHEGMIQMGMAAMTKASTPAAQGDAHTMHTAQLAEQKTMVEMVKASYGETLTPMLMPSNKAMVADLESKSGADYDRAFYTNVIAHHREGIRMVDEMTPKLANAEVQQMAAKMKADQQKEIAAMEKKVK